MTVARCLVLIVECASLCGLVGWCNVLIGVCLLVSVVCCLLLVRVCRFAFWLFGCCLL